MKPFADLYRRLDETTKTNRKVAAMRGYFVAAEPADAAWAVYFLCGRRLKRLVMSRNLRHWAAEAAGIPEWLFEESYDAVGDLAETIGLLLPPPTTEGDDVPLHQWMDEIVQPLARLDEPTQQATLIQAWSRLTSNERLVFNKLVTGSFRVGVSQGLVIRALAEASNLAPNVIAHRLMGNWDPTPEFFQYVIAPDDGETDRSRPYPFCLAHALQQEPATLGDIDQWSVEWKWDGIRAQIIRRGGEVYVWSRGEELILERFPELHPDLQHLPDGTVLDGEIVAWKDGHVLPFSELQRRIGRKTIGKKLLAEVPAHFIAFDLLEHAGQDLRQTPFAERRDLLESVVSQLRSRSDRPLLVFQNGETTAAAAESGLSPDEALTQEEVEDPTDSRIILSPLVTATSWEHLAEIRRSSRDQHVEGLMLKRRDSVYRTGRVTGLWWKWKVDPYSCDAVLIYAMRGHGRRASLYTDYTFAAWDNGKLVPFAKAYSGLSDNEILEVDRFVRNNTTEKFGPVRSVKPQLVFELAFEGIQVSSRHKSGLAVRFPRMARWRRDKTPEQADTLDSIKALLNAPVEAAT
jgi:DNA ligase-1